MLALSLEETSAALQYLRAGFEAEYALFEPVQFEEGLLYAFRGETVYVSALVKHPASGKADAQSLADAYRAMRRSGAKRAVLLATCPCGKMPTDAPLADVRVLDGDTLTKLLARHPETIDRSLLPKREKSARGEKLRALGKAVLVPPTAKQSALHMGYAALLLLTYLASKSPVALACLAFQLLRAAYGLCSRGKSAPPRLF